MGPLRTARRLPIVAALLLTGACSVSMDLPRDFLHLNPPDLLHLYMRSDLQAVTADDARIWMRTFDAGNEASVAFWTEAVEHDLVQQRGYELVAKGEVPGRNEASGVWLECAANVGGDRIGYLLALWVHGTQVRVVEFAARADVFAARVEAVRQALPSARW